MWVFELEQRGIIVASGVGYDAEAIEREGLHYAMMYGQDGPCSLTVRRAEPDEFEDAG